MTMRRGMPTVERSIPASPDVVWRVLTDPDVWPQWGPSVRRAALDEAGPLVLGSRGRIWTSVGISLPFTITEFDAGRSWAWRVAGVDATRHEVRPDSGWSRVIFAVPWWAPAYLPVCAIALSRIERMTS